MNEENAYVETSEEWVSAASVLLKHFVKFTCPECEQTFTDPDEFVYGHDCEA